MDTVTYPDPRVEPVLTRNFVPLRLKLRENPELVKRYLVAWTPCLLTADEEGRVL